MEVLFVNVEMPYYSGIRIQAGGQHIAFLDSDSYNFHHYESQVN